MYALILINVYAFHEAWCLSLTYQKQVNTISEQMSYNPTYISKSSLHRNISMRFITASIRRLHRLELAHQYISRVRRG